MSAYDSGFNDSDLELDDIGFTQLFATNPSKESDLIDECSFNNDSPYLSLKAKINKKLRENLHSPSVISPQPPFNNKHGVQITPSQKQILHNLNKRTDNNGSFFDLPERVRELLKENRGIDQLYDWQKECLNLPAVDAGRNLIYSLPTSGGKTLVAEILMFKEVINHRKDVLLILPFVSIVQEKVRHLSPFGLELNFLVEEYAGSRGKLPPTKRRLCRSIYVATIEKAHSIVNSLIDKERIDDLGLVVVDELHMIGEGGQRGAYLEMTLTKVLAAAKSTRIIGMSATLRNISDLLKFLDAEFYTNNFRPVELREYVKVENMIYGVNNRPGLTLKEKMNFTRALAYPVDKCTRQMDPDQIMGLIQEILPQNSCLIFCPTKRQCESLAQQLVRLMPQFDSFRCDANNNDDEGLIKLRRARTALLQSVKLDNEGALCPILSVTIPHGVAYHHSGLTQEERKSIEEAYLEGTLKLLCCTSTLAAGVNLPARRVIIRSPYVGADFISATQYKQMIGRAGRAGFDTSGESIIILQHRDKNKFGELLSTSCDVCCSSLMFDNGKGLRQLILSVIALKLADDFDSLYKKIIQRTFLHKQACQDMFQATKDAVQSLLDLGLITQTKTDEDKWIFKASQLGRATVNGSIDHDRASQIVKDLSRSQESLNMTSYLHLLYLATPYELTETVLPDWNIYFEKLNSLSHAEANILALLGITDSYLARKATGQRIKKPVDEFPIRRFFLTLMLHDLWRGQSVWWVAERYRQSRGLVQQLLQSASTLSVCLGHFVQEFDQFWAYQILLPNFSQKLAHCVTAELLPLMELPGVKKARARQLYDAGYRNIGRLAVADPKQLVKAVEHLSRRQANQIISSAKMILQEKLDALREEADELMLPSGPDAVSQKVSLNDNLLSEEKRVSHCQDEEEDMFS